MLIGFVVKKRKKRWQTWIWIWIVPCNNRRWFIKWFPRGSIKIGFLFYPYNDPSCNEENRGLGKSDNKFLATPEASDAAWNKTRGGARSNPYSLTRIDGSSTYWPFPSGNQGYFVLMNFAPLLNAFANAPYRVDLRTLINVLSSRAADSNQW